MSSVSITLSHVICILCLTVYSPNKITTYTNDIFKYIFSKKGFMMTSSNGHIFRVAALCAGNSPVTGEFPALRPVTRSFDVFVDLHLNKRLSKQSWGWWFETPSRPLWGHCNAVVWFNFHWTLLQRVQLITPQCEFRYWLGARQAIGRYFTQWWPGSSALKLLLKFDSHSQEMSESDLLGPKGFKYEYNLYTYLHLQAYIGVIYLKMALEKAV